MVFDERDVNKPKEEKKKIAEKQMTFDDFWNNIEKYTFKMNNTSRNEKKGKKQMSQQRGLDNGAERAIFNHGEWILKRTT